MVVSRLPCMTHFGEGNRFMTRPEEDLFLGNKHFKGGNELGRWRKCLSIKSPSGSGITESAFCSSLPASLKHPKQYSRTLSLSGHRAISLLSFYMQTGKPHPCWPHFSIAHCTPRQIIPSRLRLLSMRYGFGGNTWNGHSEAEIIARMQLFTDTKRERWFCCLSNQTRYIK